MNRFGFHITRDCRRSNTQDQDEASDLSQQFLSARLEQVNNASIMNYDPISQFSYEPSDNSDEESTAQ